MKLLKVFAALISFGFSDAKAAELKIAFDSIPTFIDNAQVNSASDFRLLIEITSCLVTSEGGEIKGDIAKSWIISKDHTEYVFKIEKNRKFSDGSIITADDVLHSLRRSVKSKFGLHLDVEKISNVEKLGDDKILIQLKESDPFFIQDISNPEFAILSKEDQKAPLGKQSFKVTSGPLSVSSFSPTSVELKRNKFFPDSNSRQFDSLAMETLSKGSREKTFQHILTKNLDYFWAPSVNSEQHKQILEAGYLHFPTRSSYTYWITFNLSSSLFSDLRNRQVIQKIFHENKVDISDREPKLQATDQLYHPMGPGRLKAIDLEKIYSNYPKENYLKNKTLRILTFRGAFYNSRICDILKRFSINCKLVEFDEFSEYSKALVESKSFDMIIMNNDFSSDYLRKNLQVALYPKRPLILVSPKDKEFENVFKKSTQSTDLNEIANLQKEVARRLLESVYVVPLFYDTRIIYAKSSLNTSKWSSIHSDFSVWKLEK